MATVRGNDVRLCDVTVGEAKTITSHSQSGSTPSTSSSIPWNIALSSEQQVLHVQMYDIMHIEEILHACKPATQLAYVHVEDGEDHSRSREVLLGYGNLMEQKEMVSCKSDPLPTLRLYSLVGFHFSSHGRQSDVRTQCTAGDPPSFTGQDTVPNHVHSPPIQHRSTCNYGRVSPRMGSYFRSQD